MQVSEDGKTLIKVSPDETGVDGLLIVPEEVTSIGYGAFYGCRRLTQIKLPTGLTSIGMMAFQDCCRLTKLELPDSVTSIAAGTFSGCRGLTQLILPSDLTFIGDFAFRSCSSLTQLNLPPAVTTIGAGAFACCYGLTQLILPSELTLIGNDTFFGCKGLKAVTLSASVTSIGKSAFEGCSGLMQLTLPSSLTWIGERAFKGCTSLTQAPGRIVIDTCNPDKYHRILSFIPEEIRPQVMSLEQYMSERATYKGLLYGLKKNKIGGDILDLLVWHMFSNNFALLRAHRVVRQNRDHQKNLAILVNGIEDEENHGLLSQAEPEAKKPRVGK